MQISLIHGLCVSGGGGEGGDGGGCHSHEVLLDCGGAGQDIILEDVATKALHGGCCQWRSIHTHSA